MWRCSNCGSLHSKEDADLALYYKHYPAKQQKMDMGTRVAYGNRLRFLKRRGLRRSSRILDYGCGVGLFVDYLKSRGYPNVSGYDQYVDAYADLNVLERRYDAVVSYDVIEHVEEPREYLRKLAGRLEVGGLLSIGTPNASEISLTGRPFSMELSQPYHRHILSDRVLMQLAAELGLKAEHVYNRLYIDSLVPGVNTRFLWTYIEARGGLLDSFFEPPKLNWAFLSRHRS